MRKAQKKQAEEFVESLGQINEEIREAMGREGGAALVLGLLEQCQEGAISLGSMIEQIEGEDTAAVRLLEDHCELLYRYHEKIRRGLPVIAEKECQILRDSLAGIEKSIRDDIAVRREVVFLPYKASMWDSLESIWRAADADPDCDAYVVPIPYYDKNRDGSFRERHYEGGLYPKDVPVVWYGDYNLAERRPDVIFIHNPYDEHNFVTSVHPDFYSGRLKEHTEMLVYVPYFVWGAIDPNDKKTIRRREHFCATPAAVNADKIVVQSETVRQIYIDILSGQAGEHTREVWEGKILGLGSPKLDKILNTRREALEIPEEWMRVIRRADGSWKKVVFYNISLGTLLRVDEKILTKLNMVLETFKKEQDGIALLWRPHPLLGAAIRAMRPQLSTEYETIVEEYRSEGWGIYDDTADVDRAVVLCDAYYGTISSVMPLCLKIGRPVMLQTAAMGKDSPAPEDGPPGPGEDVVQQAVDRGQVLVEEEQLGLAAFLKEIRGRTVQADVPPGEDAGKRIYNEILGYQG